MSKMDNVRKWLGFATAILPMTLAMAGVDADKIGPVTELAKDAEVALGEGNGQQKLAAVVDGVQQGMKAKGASEATIAATTQAVTEGLASGIRLTNEVHAISDAHHAPATTSIP